MARLNVAKDPYAHGATHEGAPAAQMTPMQALRRSVMSCLLWEHTFYLDGEEIAARINRLASQVSAEELAALAIEVRTQGNLRHVPLLLLSILARTGRGKVDLVKNTITQTIQRADELAEFLAVYAKVNGVTPDKLKSKLTHQMRNGLAIAFGKFNEYQLAKYTKDNSKAQIKMRDVLFLTHPKPKDEAQDALWKQLIAGQLATPDTWETNLSMGKDKKETFERLIRERKLGYFALMRNLRNMVQANCDLDLVREAILARKGGAEKLLPFRYIAAARAAPQLEPEIDQSLCKAIDELPRLDGLTVVMVDVSGSMVGAKVSAKSDMDRRDAAAALASIINGKRRVFTFADDVTEVPPRRGMAGVDAICKVHSGGTRLFDAIREVNRTVDYDRIIVITDEQAFPSQSRGMYERSTGGGCPPPKGKGYLINVACYENGVAYERQHWNHLDGFSENVIRWIVEYENQAL